MRTVKRRVDLYAGECAGIAMQVSPLLLTARGDGPTCCSNAMHGGWMQITGLDDGVMPQPALIQELVTTRAQRLLG